MTSGSLQKSASEIASAHPEVEFALVLARTIDSLQSNPDQLRSAVYDLARHKLAQLSHDSPSDKDRLMQALEVAIAGVEAHTRNNAVPAPALPPTRPIRRERNEALIAAEDIEQVVQGKDTVRHAAVSALAEPSRVKRTKWSSSTPLRYLAMLIFFAGLAGIIVAQRRGWSPASLEAVVSRYWPARPIETPAAKEPTAVVNATPVQPEPVRKIDPLIPTAYGVYAVSGDRLYELQTLQGRVPDPRVAISAAILKPSETVLPDGMVRFVVFRRETTGGDSSDPIELRVVAQVRQATNFDASGKPVVSSEKTWVIRNISLPYHAAPLKDEAGMYQVLPRDPNLSLSPGRYVLALNGQAFDFSVEGKIADKRQCLEQIVAANGVFYSECQNP